MYSINGICNSFYIFKYDSVVYIYIDIQIFVDFHSHIFHFDRHSHINIDFHSHEKSTKNIFLP